MVCGGAAPASMSCLGQPVRTELLGLGLSRGGAMTAGKRFKRLVRERARRMGESYVSARQALLAKKEARSENHGNHSQ